MKNLLITRDDGKLVILQRWFSWIYVFFFGLAAVALALFLRQDFGRTILAGLGKLLASPTEFYAAASKASFYDFGTNFFFSIIFFVLLFFEYYCLCTMINRTRIRATQEKLSVSHGPLPWTLGRTVKREDLAEFILQTRVQKTDKTTNTFFRLAARGRGKPVPLTAYSLDDETLKPIKAELEAYYRVGGGTSG